MSYSIAQGNIINVIAFTSQPEKEGTPFDEPWVVDCSKEEVLDCYSGWEPEVDSLLKASYVSALIDPI